MGPRTGEGIRCRALPSAERRILSRDGFSRRCGDGALRHRAGMAGCRPAKADWMAARRRIRQSESGKQLAASSWQLALGIQRLGVILSDGSPLLRTGVEESL